MTVPLPSPSPLTGAGLLTARLVVWATGVVSVSVTGGSVWVRDGGHTLGHAVRVRILARDVSIAREQILATSILNTLPAKVVALADEPHPAQQLVRLQVGDSPVLARVTRRSACALELKPGQAVWAQVKSVALIG